MGLKMSLPERLNTSVWTERMPVALLLLMSFDTWPLLRTRSRKLIVLVDVVLPNLGFGMEEGQLLAWLKAPGDAVRKGEALAEIEGDKTTVELEALTDGVLEQQLVAAETTVPVGTVLARIRSGAAAAVSSARAAPASACGKGCSAACAASQARTCCRDCAAVSTQAACVAGPASPGAGTWHCAGRAGGQQAGRSRYARGH